MVKTEASGYLSSHFPFLIFIIFKWHIKFLHSSDGRRITMEQLKTNAHDTHRHIGLSANTTAKIPSSFPFGACEVYRAYYPL